jgi:hypothetical protein
MRSAQIQQAIDPNEIEADQRDSGSGYRRIAQEVFSRIEERLGELKNKASEAPSPVPRASFGRVLFRAGVVAVLVIGVAGAAIAYEWPRSETVRMLVSQVAPQSFLEMMPAVDGQEAYGDAGSTDGRQAYAGMGASYRTAGDNEDPNASLSPMQQQQLIQKLVQDVATLQQGMDQLRAGQDQMLRMMLRNPAQNAQARAPAGAVPRPLGTTGLAAPGAVGINPAPPVPRRPTTSIIPPSPRY